MYLIFLYEAFLIAVKTGRNLKIAKEILFIKNRVVKSNPTCYDELMKNNLICRNDLLKSNVICLDDLILLESGINNFSDSVDNFNVYGGRRVDSSSFTEDKQGDNNKNNNNNKNKNKNNISIESGDLIYKHSITKKIMKNLFIEKIRIINKSNLKIEYLISEDGNIPVFSSDNEIYVYSCRNNIYIKGGVLEGGIEFRKSFYLERVKNDPMEILELKNENIKIFSRERIIGGREIDKNIFIVKGKILRELGNDLIEEKHI